MTNYEKLHTMTKNETVDYLLSLGECFVADDNLLTECEENNYDDKRCKGCMRKWLDLSADRMSIDDVIKTLDVAKAEVEWAKLEWCYPLDYVSALEEAIRLLKEYKKDKGDK